MLTNTKQLTASGDYLELPIPADGYWSATIASDPTAASNADFVIQVEGVVGDFITIKIINLITGSAADKITGASKVARADVTGFRKVRLTRTDANAGIGLAAMSLQRNN